MTCNGCPRAPVAPGEFACRQECAPAYGPPMCRMCPGSVPLLFRMSAATDRGIDVETGLGGECRIGRLPPFVGHLSGAAGWRRSTNTDWRKGTQGVTHSEPMQELLQELGPANRRSHREVQVTPANTRSSTDHLSAKSPSELHSGFFSSFKEAPGHAPTGREALGAA